MGQIFTSLRCRVSRCCVHKQGKSHFQTQECLFLCTGDANRQISEYKFKLSKAEQEIGTMEQNVRQTFVDKQSNHVFFAARAWHQVSLLCFSD